MATGAVSLALGLALREVVAAAAEVRLLVQALAWHPRAAHRPGSGPVLLVADQAAAAC
jgi:hypothetical protein